MTEQKKQLILRRYTDLPALVYLLTHKSLTLLDPNTWDDTNDSFYIEQYRVQHGLSKVLALCMTQAQETYHHWRIFSHGSAGVCIQFDQERLIGSLKKTKGVLVGKVEYQKINMVLKNRELITQENLPFTKRIGYLDENEYRIIFESKIRSNPFLDVPISLDSIVKITLSPWLNERLSKSVTTLIHSIADCEFIKVSRSTLVANQMWKNFAKKIL